MRGLRVKSWDPVDNPPPLIRFICLEENMAEINWSKDIDAALAQAKNLQKPVLVDFSAAPM